MIWGGYSILLLISFENIWLDMVFHGLSLFLFPRLSMSWAYLILDCQCVNFRTLHSACVKVVLVFPWLICGSNWIHIWVKAFALKLLVLFPVFSNVLHEVILGENIALDLALMRWYILTIQKSNIRDSLKLYSCVLRCIFILRHVLVTKVSQWSRSFWSILYSVSFSRGDHHAFHTIFNLYFNY